LHVKNFLKKGDFDKIRQHLDRLEGVKNLPFEKGGEWELRYKGPTDAEKIGIDWLPFSFSGINRWKIDGGRIIHKPERLDEEDCYLMTSGEYGGVDEDIKVAFKVRTSENKNLIRDLSLVLSGASSEVGIHPDLVGYTACSGSNGNTEGRIQKKGGNLVVEHEELEPDTEYQINVERTGGRLKREIINLNTGEQGHLLEVVDTDAIYDKQNHVGFTTFAGEAEIYDIEIFTRKSMFTVDQFRIPFNVEVGINDKKLKDRVYKLRIGKKEIRNQAQRMLLFEDITKQKKAEEALRENEERFRLMAELSPFPISIIDSDGRYLFLNKKFIEVFGYSLEDIPTARDWFRLAYPDREYRREVVSAWKSDLENIGKGLDRPRTFSVICKDGSVREILFRPVIMEDEKQFIIYEDITERRQLEEERSKASKLESLGILAGGIAHDFNNILTAILGNISLGIMLPEKGKKIKKVLREAEKAGLRAKNLTQQLLTFSRGGIPIKRKTCISGFIKDSAGFSLRGSNVICKYSIADDLWPVEVDEGQISQVVNNLIINADQAMPEGGGNSAQGGKCHCRAER